VTADGGYQVSDQTGSPIILPSGAKQLIINTQGSVSVNSKLIGTIGVFTVENEQEKLKNLGNNLLKPVGQTAEIATKYYIKQFGLEDSNVSAIKESVLMIEILRQYEHAQKIIDEHEQSNKKMLNVSSKNV
jgi:flagellar basal-body rod protein FlgF